MKSVYNTWDTYNSLWKGWSVCVLTYYPSLPDEKKSNLFFDPTDVEMLVASPKVNVLKQTTIP